MQARLTRNPQISVQPATRPPKESYRSWRRRGSPSEESPPRSPTCTCISINPNRHRALNYIKNVTAKRHKSWLERTKGVWFQITRQKFLDSSACTWQSLKKQAHMCHRLRGHLSAQFTAYLFPTHGNLHGKRRLRTRHHKVAPVWPDKQCTLLLQIETKGDDLVMFCTRTTDIYTGKAWALLGYWELTMLPLQLVLHSWYCTEHNGLGHLSP